MTYDEFDAGPENALTTATWQAALAAGVLTLILGIVISFKPSGSLNVIAVLVGIVAIISGIFLLVRVFDREEHHRIWLGVAGFLYIVVGVVLIRHISLTVALFGLLVGIAWIVQGIAALIGAFSGSREGAVWWGVFGAISIIGGIVVVSAPTTSITVLTVLVGIWFIVMGIFEIVAGFMIKRAVSSGPPSASRSAGEEAASR
jgi:uncharacterized membrane protein HdeD (DUF308 family)